MNCLAVEHDGAIVVIDCGVMFPDRELGVDVIHPDFRWLLERRDQVRAILVTHGHEDHIGALPYLLREVQAPVHAPPYALALVRERLEEHDLPREPVLLATRPGARFSAGPFDIEPVRVTHSIPDATALVIRTPAGILVHTGDFKIDPRPADGERFDEARLGAVGDEGVLCLLSDSTNAWAAGESGAEADVTEALDALVAGADARVVVSIFASNVHRLRALFELARRHGRRVCLLGRSLTRHLAVGIETGYLADPGSLLVHPDGARSVPRRELLVVATGTQGEAPAALARLAEGKHPALELEPGDEVILSARIIPGHEQGVYAVVNALERLGVRTRFRTTDPAVHVSGHAHAEEQRRMLELVRPRFFVPVHGTLMHLKRHAELARATGVEDALVVENGSIVGVSADGLRVTGHAPSGRVHVDAGEEVPDDVLRDRARLAELGIAVAVVLVSERGELDGAPEVVTRGVVTEEREPELVADARTFLADEIGDWLARKRRGRAEVDPIEIEERTRRALKWFLGKRVGRRPLTYAVVVRPRAR